MTQNTEKKTRTRRPLRVAAVAAAAAALLTVGVSAASPQVAGWIEGKITSIVQLSRFKSEMTLDNGMVVTGYGMPNAAVEDRDGRAVLVVGEDEVDVTDALLAGGEYVYEVTDESGLIGHITVTGTPEDWNLFVTLDTGENSISYTITPENFEHGDEVASYSVTVGGEAD